MQMLRDVTPRHGERAIEGIRAEKRFGGEPFSALSLMRLSGQLIRITTRMGNSLCVLVNSMEQETREIARGLRRHDPDLLGELIDRYQYRLPRYLWALTGSQAAVEDLFQETWIRVLEKSRQYDPRWRFETWLFSIARNLAIDLLRRRQPESLDALLDAGDGRTAQEWPDRKSATPFEIAVASEEAERVRDLLQQLPPDAREVLTLRFQEDMGINEIAEVLGAPVSTVKSRLYRGLEALRSLLEEA